jgi:hypothetical protein
VNSILMISDTLMNNSSMAIKKISSNNLSKLLEASELKL